MTADPNFGVGGSFCQKEKCKFFLNAVGKVTKNSLCTLCEMLNVVQKAVNLKITIDNLIIKLYNII